MERKKADNENHDEILEKLVEMRVEGAEFLAKLYKAGNVSVIETVNSIIGT